MKAFITKSTGSWYTAITGNGEIIQCRVKGKLRIQGIKSTNPVAVGDHVLLDIDSENNANIYEVLPRKNYIIRKSINLSKQTQILAANIDQAVLICSLVAPKTLTGFIDRFLVTAEAYQIPVIIVFNKTDTYDSREELDYLLTVYSQIGYRVLPTSVITGENISVLEDMMQNKVTLVAGNSGVGKSSIINVIEPGLSLKTAPISDSYLTGKHTTTFAEMFKLRNGGFIIDSPGVKSFGIVDFGKEELHHFFPEMFRLSPSCKYYNCVHVNENACTVKQAVEDGLIAGFRYDNYIKLYNGEDLETKPDER